MVENKSLFQSKLFQATLVVSIILISSAIFISQTDKIFGKAASYSGISGTIVLFDQGNSQGIKTTSWFTNIYLPSGSCNAYANYCFGDNTIGNSKCVSKQIFNSSGNLFTVELRPGVYVGGSGSCGSTYIKQQANSFIYATCSVSAWDWGGASASVTSATKTVASCSATGSCTNCAAVGFGDSGTAVGDPAGTVFTASCTGCCSKSTTVAEYSGELPQPLGHLDVTYNCP